jgi:biopolymer transport protein TolQ
MLESTVALAPAADHSMVGLFLQADVIVKAVMCLLALASVACWAVIFDKAVRLTAAHNAARRFAQQIKGDQLNGAAPATGGLVGDILANGVRAARDEDSSESRADRRDRIERAMRAAMIDRLKQLESGLSLLATVGSTAPFIGLFGTVWGIMNSFTAIAASKDTSLAVVAPGIAEALLATALGLVAAIPAVIAYNKLASSLSGIAHRLTMAINELGDRWSRRGAASLRGAAE